MAKSTYAEFSVASAYKEGKYPPHTMGTRGYFFRKSRHSGIAAAICGPGMTETARSSAPDSRMIRSNARSGCGSTLPSTMQYSSLPSRTAAIASAASGKRRFFGFVARGWRMIIMAYANLPSRIQKRDGGRRPSNRAFQGRHHHFHPYQGR